MIVLHKMFVDADLGECALIVTFQKKSAVVPEHARFEKQDAGEAGLNFLH